MLLLEETLFPLRLGIGIQYAVCRESKGKQRPTEQIVLAKHSLHFQMFSMIFTVLKHCLHPEGLEP